jgi:hypothetical protein
MKLHKTSQFLASQMYPFSTTRIIYLNMRKGFEFRLMLNKIPIVTYIVLRVKTNLGSLENTKFNVAHIPLCHTIHNIFPLFFVFSNDGPTIQYHSEPEQPLAKVKLAEQLRVRKRTLNGLCREIDITKRSPRSHGSSSPLCGGKFYSRN